MVSLPSRPALPATFEFPSRRRRRTPALPLDDARFPASGWWGAMPCAPRAPVVTDGTAGIDCHARITDNRARGRGRLVLAWREFARPHDTPWQRRLGFRKKAGRASRKSLSEQPFGSRRECGIVYPPVVMCPSPACRRLDKRRGANRDHYCRGGCSRGGQVRDADGGVVEVDASGGASVNPVRDRANRRPVPRVAAVGVRPQRPRPIGASSLPPRARSPVSKAR